MLKSTVTGYRKGRSTGTNLLKFKDDIKIAMKSGEAILPTLVDFSKAFDTIAHDKVITKLLYLVSRQINFKLFKP